MPKIPFHQRAKQLSELSTARAISRRFAVVPQSGFMRGDNQPPALRGGAKKNKRAGPFGNAAGGRIYPGGAEHRGCSKTERASGDFPDVLLSAPPAGKDRLQPSLRRRQARSSSPAQPHDVSTLQCAIINYPAPVMRDVARHLHVQEKPSTRITTTPRCCSNSSCSFCLRRLISLMNAQAGAHNATASCYQSTSQSIGLLWAL